MTTERVARAKPDVIIMHPGPMNRGVEIASEVADGPYSVILEQVANGVAVRMAVLYLLAGGVGGDGLSGWADSDCLKGGRRRRSGNGRDGVFDVLIDGRSHRARRPRTCRSTPTRRSSRFRPASSSVPA